MTKQHKIRDRQSDETLKLALFHLQTEITGLRSSAEAYQKARNHHMPTIVFNALIVSFAVHFRNIYDFLYAGRSEKPPRRSDIIAEDFYRSDIKWKAIEHTRSERLDEDRKRLNQQIAHLSYFRLGAKTEDRTWDFGRILNEISPGIEAFYTHLPEQFLDVESVREFDHPIWRKRVKLNKLFNRLERGLKTIRNSVVSKFKGSR